MDSNVISFDDADLVVSKATRFLTKVICAVLRPQFSKLGKKGVKYLERHVEICNGAFIHAAVLDWCTSFGSVFAVDKSLEN